MRQCIELWCWDFSVFTALCLSRSLFLYHTYLTSPTTSAHAEGTNNNKHDRPFTQRKGGPLSRKAWHGTSEIDFNCIIWCGYSVCFSTLEYEYVSGVFQYICAVWRIWQEMACRTQRFLVKTNRGSPLLHTQDKQIGVIAITNECSHNSLSVCYKAQNITFDT